VYPEVRERDARPGLVESLSTIWEYLRVQTPVRPSDVIFAFGSANLGVPRTAAALFRDGIAPWVLVTGGAPPGDPTTEAARYSEILVAAGVPAARIVAEDRAANTAENVVFGMARLQEHGITVGGVTLVGFPTSLRRCIATFARHFPTVRIASRAAFPTLEQYDAPLAEVARTLLVELDRLDAYPRAGYFAPQPQPEAVRAARWEVARWLELPPRLRLLPSGPP